MKAGGVCLSVLLFSVTSSYGRKTGKDRLPFVCPAECKPSPYEPICSRGKSYGDLCTLMQMVCNGDADLDIHGDIEACPEYDKDAEAKGASVEAIDKNGVVFRGLFDLSKDDDAGDSGGVRGKSAEDSGTIE